MGIIINADDFGLNSSVNNAIKRLFNDKLINSTTLMANMPGFEEAVELAFNNKFQNRIGIHLNLDEGQLLTSGIYRVSFFKNENHLNLLKQRMKLFLLTSNDKELIYREFGAQIEKILNTGIKITHIDTHHQINEIWPITQIILALIRNYKIPYMRIADNLNRKTKFYKLVYRNFLNGYISIKHSNFSDYFGNQLEVISMVRKNQSIVLQNRIEIMVHPDYNAEGNLIDIIDGEEFNFNYPEDFLNLIKIPDHISPTAI
jgi:chitin disaccharide deacetylase